MAVDEIQVAHLAQVVAEDLVAAVVVTAIVINHVAATSQREMILAAAISVAEMIPALLPARKHPKNHVKRNSRNGK